MSKSKEAYMDMQQEQRDSENYPQQSAPISYGLTISGNNLLKMDMATIETIARSIVQEVRDGNKDALDVLIYAKKGAAFFKAIDDNVKEFAYSKQYATKGQPYEVHGCKVEASELGVKYDYTVCQSDKWTDLKTKADAAKKELEEHEKFLKTIKGKLEVVGKDFDIQTIYEPGRSGTMGYKISIG
jgi:hypothetical protein